MKIAYFHYLDKQDTALHHARQFTEAVRSLGHSISTHPMNLAPTDADRFKDRVRRTLKRKFSPYLHEFKELMLYPAHLNCELKIVRQEQPDVMLTRYDFLKPSCLAVANRSGKPLVLEVNGPTCESALYLDEYHHIPFVGDFLERLMLRGAAQVVVVSDALRRHLTERYDFDPEKVTVNHNGADCDRFHPGISGSAVRNQFRLERKNVVGFVGSLHRWRAPDFLLEIVGRLAHRRDVVFLFVGDGDEWEVLRDQFSSSNLGNSVVFAGRVGHEVLPQFLAAMDVALLPESTFYMSPLKLFEYMAAGLPTVAPRYDAIEEIISHGETGLLFRPANSEAAAQYISLLLNDPAKRKEMGAAAVHEVTQKFSWHHNAERVIAVCRRALKSSQLPARSNDPVAI